MMISFAELCSTRHTLQKSSSIISTVFEFDADGVKSNNSLSVGGSSKGSLTFPEDEEEEADDINISLNCIGGRNSGDGNDNDDSDGNDDNTAFAKLEFSRNSFRISTEVAYLTELFSPLLISINTSSFVVFFRSRKDLIIPFVRLYRLSVLFLQSLYTLGPAFSFF